MLGYIWAPGPNIKNNNIGPEALYYLLNNGPQAHY